MRLIFLLAVMSCIPGRGWAQVASVPDTSRAGEVVVLLHGLARSSRSMASLEKYLERQGYAVVNVDYPSTEHPVDYLSDVVLADVMAACCRGATVHFVTHSMGGIIVRYYLRGHQHPNLGRVVMLSPPNQGSELVDAFKNNRLFEVVNGPAGIQLGTDSTSIPMQLGPVTFDLGVITGDKSYNPLFSSLIPGPDDGKVAVRRARVEGMHDFLVVPYTHTFIMNRTEVKRQVVYYLRHGSFDRSAVSGAPP